MRPPWLALIIARAAAWVIRNVPRQLTAQTVSQTSARSSSRPACGATAALLTQKSSRPLHTGGRVDDLIRPRFLTDVGDDGRDALSLEDPRRSLTIPAHSRSAATTLAPGLRRSVSTITRPMPRAAPVTITLWPE